MTCNDFTPRRSTRTTTQQLALFRRCSRRRCRSRTNRTHCIVWSDYDTQPQVALAHGIRFDTNYYYWPDTVGQRRAGHVHRFGHADAVREARRHDDRRLSGDDADDRRIGPDLSVHHRHAARSRARARGLLRRVRREHAHRHAVHAGSEAIVASAQARGVPVDSRRSRCSTWLDGRNGSSFGSITWNGTRWLLYRCRATWGATEFKRMLPAFGGHSVADRADAERFSCQFHGADHQRRYLRSVLRRPPGATRRNTRSTPRRRSSRVVCEREHDFRDRLWTTNEVASSRVDYGLSPSALFSTIALSDLTTAHSVRSIRLSGAPPITTAYVGRPEGERGECAGRTVGGTFTTAAPPSLNCPCSIWPNTAIRPIRRSLTATLKSSA